MGFGKSSWMTHGRWYRGETQPAWGYLEGQLMREWVSPSASVWRNQSVLRVPLALYQWKPNGRQVSGSKSRFSTQPFLSEHTALHYTHHWLHTELDQNENRLGHQQDPAKHTSSTPRWDISLLLWLLTSYSIKCELHVTFLLFVKIRATRKTEYVCWLISDQIWPQSESMLCGINHVISASLYEERRLSKVRFIYRSTYSEEMPSHYTTAKRQMSHAAPLMLHKDRSL